jgi:hypothetical protein
MSSTGELQQGRGEIAMGWDAYSEHGEFQGKWPHKSKAAFAAASRRVKRKAGSVDWLLERGGLDVSNCAYALENATGESAWDQDGWEAKKVKRLAKSAQWPALEDVDKSEWWAILSAREFLETCAKLGLRIDFSW